jgi:hypothetical protein
MKMGQWADPTPTVVFQGHKNKKQKIRFASGGKPCPFRFPI